MDSQYYKDYYTLERNHWWFLARSSILKRYINRNISGTRQKIRILNVGVATGATSEMLSIFGDVTSVEYEKECIDFIRDKVAINVIQGSILDLPFEDDSFDLVCAFDVVEHVQDDASAIKELGRVCVPNGSVLITVPAFMSLWSEHDLINHHFRRYKKPDVEKLFNTKDGSLIFSSYFNTVFFFPIYLLRKITGVIRNKKKKPQSDFSKYNPGILNRILFHIMNSETIAITRQKPLPIGVSIFCHWKKTN